MSERSKLIDNEVSEEQTYSRLDQLNLKSETPSGLFSGKKTTLLVTLCILTAEMCERLTYYSIISNLVLYSTSTLDIEQADATTINQIFSGFAYIIPIIGGFLADAYLGRFATITVFCLIYIIGTILLPASAIDYSSWGGSDLSVPGKTGLYMTGLVFVGLGTGGIKANVGPFGAEQVQGLGKDAVQSFFNWFYWVINVGALIAYTGVAYVQQEVSFAWGYFIPMISMIVAVIVFVATRSKYIRTRPTGSILEIVWGIVREGGCCKPPPPANPKLPAGSENKVFARAKRSFGGSYDNHLVDGVTSVLKVTPFCLLVVMFWAIYAQMANTFFAQSERMDIRLGDGVNVPAAALNAFNTISIIIFIPVVDRVIYPLFDKIGRPLTYLKRMGIGMVLSMIAVIVAGIIEIKRKEIMKEDGGSHIQVLANQNFTASSMSVFAQVPQFALIGAGEIFTSVTSMEFAYNQAPVAMQGLLTGLFLAASGVGNWVSSLILVIVQAATKEDPWWGDEINDLKMENLMFLLGGLMGLNFVVFCVVAHFYTYQDRSKFEKTETDYSEDEVIYDSQVDQRPETADFKHGLD